MFSLRCKCIVKSLYLVQNLQHLVLYSTSTHGFNQTFADYLVNHLGFSQQQALSTSTKLQTRKVNYSKLPDNANSVVNFLKQNDFDDTHLRKIVSSYPRILCCNVDKTLKPKFQLLQDQGFSGFNLISFVSNSPAFVVKHVNHSIPNMRIILGSDEVLIKFFRKSNHLTTLATLENLVSNVALLENDYGIDIQVIRNSIRLHPWSFLRSTQFFRNVVVRVEEELGIPRDSGVFMYGIQMCCSCSEKNIKSKFQLFKSFGWTKYQVSQLIRRSPNALKASEENIRKKLGFLMNELGYDPEFLASHSALFTYSLEKRMLPRHRVLRDLKEKGLLSYNFYTATLKSEAQFLKQLVEPFKEAVPSLLEIYRNSKGCPEY